MSFFETVEALPEDPIFSLPKLFKEDAHPLKVNLGIGAYQDSEGLPFVLTTVRDVELQLIQKEKTMEYLPILGDPAYIHESLKLIFGDNHPYLQEKKIIGAQTVGGTNALWIGAAFLADHGFKIVYLSDPTWPNHHMIFRRAGLAIKTYPHYDNAHHCIPFEDLCSCIKTMPPSSIILLQSCCHNPTGMDFSFSQWQEISHLIKQQKVFPFFDLSYQGFGKGIDEDAKPIRYFIEQGHELMVANSFSKNFGMYGERAGLLALATNQPEISLRAESHIKQIIRATYSNPPRLAAKIVATILNSADLTKAWKHELQAMRGRISAMREALSFGLQSKSSHLDFSFLNSQTGIFSFIGLSPTQVQRLRTEKGVFILENSRLNIAGINPHNLDYVIDSILHVVKK
jgi:aspartate aminotransferase